jgi:hypothetical protein
MSSNGRNDRHEAIADILALVILLVFLAAFVIGIIDRTYQMPTALNLVVGLAATFLFGQRIARGDKPNEIQKNGNSNQPDSNSNDSGDAGNLDSGRTGDSDASADSQNMARNSDAHGGIQRRSNAANDTTFNEGAD